MRIKHIEIEIEPGNPFANCKLDRKKHADILTDIINSYADGFVLAINNKWGTGKTTFVKMWEQDLKDKEYQTVYFNAWENDFENNPLTALMGELKTLTTKTTEPKFKNALKKAAILSKNIAPIVAKSVADKYINTAEIKDLIVGVTKGITDVFENDVNEYAKKKKSISEFRQNLSEFIANTSDGKPLIFIVDELDRCRPNYAVTILEQIKHFFTISNIVFILSIDKTQLGNAIRGVYGSDKLDADEYLRRFIDIEYSIPSPEPILFSRYLYEYFDFDSFFKGSERTKYRDLQPDRDLFLRICEILFATQTLTLREQEKIFALARISLRSFNQNHYVVPFAYLFLIFIKITHNDFYQSIKDKRLSLEELQNQFFEVIRLNLNDESETELLWLEAYLLIFYNNFLHSRSHRKMLYENDSATGKNKLNIFPKVNTDAVRFLKILESLGNIRGEGDLKLGYFLNRIELLEKIQL